MDSNISIGVRMFSMHSHVLSLSPIYLRVFLLFRHAFFIVFLYVLSIVCFPIDFLISLLIFIDFQMGVPVQAPCKGLREP